MDFARAVLVQRGQKLDRSGGEASSGSEGMEAVAIGNQEEEERSRRQIEAVK